jgi:hypothetical protein
MVQHSFAILDLFGAPELSDLDVCGAGELPALPDYLSSAIWHHIYGMVHKIPAARHLDLIFLRRTKAAFSEYNAGRACLLKYIDGVEGGDQRLGTYHDALMHFEQCLNAFWEAALLFNKMEHKILNLQWIRPTLYPRGSTCDLARINKLNSVAKHFDIEKAEQTTAPIWITNVGLKSADATVSFDELRENLVSLSEIARQTFVEIPNEVYARDCAKATGKS